MKPVFALLMNKALIVNNKVKLKLVEGLGNRCSLFEVAGFNAGLCEFQGWILPTRPAAALLGEELGKGDKMRKEN